MVHGLDITYSIAMKPVAIKPIGIKQSKLIGLKPIVISIYFEGGWSANEIRKSANPQICGLTKFVRLADFPQM